MEFERTARNNKIEFWRKRIALSLGLKVTGGSFIAVRFGIEIQK